MTTNDSLRAQLTDMIHLDDLLDDWAIPNPEEKPMTTDDRPATTPKPIIVGVESHSFQGDGPTCTGVLGYAQGDFRHGQVCQASPNAAIHGARKES